MNFFKRLFSSKRLDPIQAEKSEIILESNCPGSPVWAIVEQDSRVAFLYLIGGGESRIGTKHCWIRNLKPAPLAYNKVEIQDGQAPMLPAENCKFPEGQSPLRAKDLEIVWFPEGDAIALLEKGAILAVIPAWGGMGGFSGYARDAVGESPICWEMPAESALMDRVIAAQQYRKRWDLEPTPFQFFQPKAVDYYEEIFGKCDQYYALDGGNWPPVGLYHRNGPSQTVFITVGMSLRPQPATEFVSEKSEALKYVEVGMLLPAGLWKDEIQEIGNNLSSIVALPWGNNTWIGEGHTSIFPALAERGFPAVIFTKSNPHFPQVSFDHLSNQKVNLLWAIPITEAEQRHVMETNDFSLLDELKKLGTEVFTFDRKRIF